jgi:small subunit ribosomal protein S22
MTEDQLEESIKMSEEKARILLQMPPVLPPRKDIKKVIGFDAYLQGLDPDNSTIILTDISLNGNDRDRLVICRDPDGTLRYGNWEERSKVNNAYFPTPGRTHKIPPLFIDRNVLHEVLERASPTDNTYEFVLDRASLQFEPDDPKYIEVVEYTYASIDKKQNYDYLSSTRHYGPMVFYLVRTRQMDNLLIHYIKSERISPDAVLLVSLFHKIFAKSESSSSQSQSQEGEDPNIAKIRQYIESSSIKKSELELALNWYLETEQGKRDMTEGLQRAHGM